MDNNIRLLDDVYPKIYDFQELYLSYLEARKNKRFRDDVLLYSDNLEYNLIETQNELIWKSYRVGKYKPFYVTEPKKRLVMSLQFKDRIVQWAIYRQLEPFYDKMFIHDSYACRKDKGALAAANRLQYWLRQVGRKTGRWYYLKLDISKYFYRVDHSVLLDILKRRIKDGDLLWLLDTIINSEDTRFGLPAGVDPSTATPEMWRNDVGMPIGNLTSQLFANIYLNELDQFCKHELKTHYYVRYMDDVIILGADKRELMQIKCEIARFLKENLHLDLNNKTAIRPVEHGIEFVGYRIWATHRKIKRQTSRRIIRRVKNMCEHMGDDEEKQESFNRSVASYKGLLKHCESYGLRHKLNQIYTTSKDKQDLKAVE